MKKFDPTMKCPMCHGDGSFGLIVDANNECGYCETEGEVSLFRWLYWYIIVIFWEETVPRWWNKLIARFDILTGL